MRSIICVAAALPTVLNCGYGHGYSVREVLDERAARGRAAAHDQGGAAPRGRPAGAGRAGRAHSLAARLDPQLDDLDAIVDSSLRWEREAAARAMVGQQPLVSMPA